MFGVDYSFTRPNVQCMKEKGVNYVVRYLSGGFSLKDLTPDEAKELQDAGIDIVTVWQTTAGFMISDFNTGRDMAEQARAQATQCGQPDDRPIYWALDVDPTRLSDEDLSAVIDFLHGVSRIEDPNTIGIYGGYDAIDILKDDVNYRWQTYAWSNDPETGEPRLHEQANLYQFLNGQDFCGGRVDFNDSKTPDFGQWNYNTNDQTSESGESEKMDLVTYEDWQSGEPVFMTNWAYKIDIPHNNPHHQALRFFKIAGGEDPNALRIARDIVDAIPTLVSREWPEL